MQLPGGYYCNLVTMFIHIDTDIACMRFIPLKNDIRLDRFSKGEREYSKGGGGKCPPVPPLNAPLLLA